MWNFVPNKDTLHAFRIQWPSPGDVGGGRGWVGVEQEVWCRAD